LRRLLAGDRPDAQILFAHPEGSSRTQEEALASRQLKFNDPRETIKLELLTFAETLTRLRGEAGHAIRPGEPNRLPLTNIKTAEVVFQPRDIQAAFLATDGHVKGLAEAVKEGGADAFDPLTVWWSGRGWYVIDGHHRLMALRKVQRERSGSKIETVPVTVFTGTLNDAISQSAALNSKDKLPMRKADKLERAWKLVCLDGMTKKQIHEATTISGRTIATMREKRRGLLAREEQPLEWFWKDVLADQRPTNHDEEWEERQAREWMERFVKAFGTKLAEQPEIAARALRLYSERLPIELVRQWPEEARAISDEVEAEEF